MSDHFQKTLQKSLKGQNLSMVARELGLSKSLLFDWVKGRRSPSMKNINNLKKIADHVGLSLEQLLIGEKKESHVLSSVQFQDGERKYNIKIERIKT